MKCPYCGFNHLEPQPRCMRCRKPLDNLVGEQSDSSVSLELMRSVVAEKSIPKPEINEEENDPAISPETAEPENLSEHDDELSDEGPKENSAEFLEASQKEPDKNADQSGVEFTQNQTVDVESNSDLDETVPAPEDEEQMLEEIQPEDEESDIGEAELSDDGTDIEDEDPDITVLPIEMISGSESDLTVVAVDADDQTNAELIIEHETKEKQVADNMPDENSSVENEETDDYTEPLSLPDEDRLLDETIPTDDGTEETTALLEKIDKLVDEMTGFEDIDIVKDKLNDDDEASYGTVQEAEAEKALLCEAAKPLVEDDSIDEISLSDAKEEMTEDEITELEPEDLSDASLEDVGKDSIESPAENPDTIIEEESTGTGLYDEFKDAKPEQLALETSIIAENSASLSCEKPVIPTVTDESMADVYQTSGTWNESRLDNFFDENLGHKGPPPDEVSVIEICPGNDEPEENKPILTEKMKPAKLPFDTSVSCETIEEQVEENKPEIKTKNRQKIKISKITLKSMAAGLLDFTVWFTMGIILFETSALFTGAHSLHGSVGEWVSMIILPIIIMTSILALLYGGLFGTILGRTPGMMIFGLQMVDNDGKRPDINRAFIRSGLVLGAVATMGISLMPALKSETSETFISKISGISIK
jgi:RDD family